MSSSAPQPVTATNNGRYPTLDLCTDDVDYTAGKMLLQLRAELAKRGVEIAVVTPHESILQELGRFGIDRSGIYPTVDAAMAALGAPRA